MKIEQPAWCNYPDATTHIWGCSSLLNGLVTGEGFCKNCDCYNRMPDSGYLNSIGLGDTYVRKQMERIFNRNMLKANIEVEGQIKCWNKNLKE